MSHDHGDHDHDAAWEAQLALGFGEMDHDHRQQARAVAALEGAVRRGGDPEVIASLLLGLIESTHEHIESEQRLMRRWNNPLNETHLHSHERLMVELRAIRDEHAAGQLVIDEARLAALRRWLTDHIRAMDHALAEYLKQREETRES